MNRDTAQINIKTPPPGPKARKWAEFHRRYAARSTYHEAFIWDRSQPAVGPFVTDVDGNVILDFVSHVGSSALGYNHPALVSMAAKLQTIDPDRYAGCDFIGAWGEDPEKSEIPTPSHLHSKLMEITSQFGFGSAFFTNSGAEAVENAIKICYDHKKNYGYGICFYGAFHGRTLGALSLNRSKKIQRDWFPQIPNIADFPYCTCRAHPCNCGWMVCCTGKEGTRSRLDHYLDPDIGLVDPEEVAFIILEPIQGESGYNVPSMEFMKEVERLAKKYSIPLISDEIQAGLGRTGKWWAIEHFGVQPDIITVAKPLRVGATLGKTELFPQQEYRISSTWGEGNALSSAIGYTIIEVIQKENLLDNATRLGKYFLTQLKGLQKKFSFIVEVRGIGLMDGLEIDSRERRDRIIRQALDRGLLLLGCGYKVIRFLPPLDVRQREIDMALEILEEAFRES
ncbi:MAG: aminotransferase class III-fold pyridoxal phosphate-dependent enzyme [Deltaproteobacteria bacterium]|nr:aminotransferase class III-fold pyridoxal phosphate-dependent enzyme [Deltaproteobacteria bacterium]